MSHPCVYAVQLGSGISLFKLYVVQLGPGISLSQKKAHMVYLCKLYKWQRTIRNKERKIERTKEQFVANSYRGATDHIAEKKN